MNFLYHQIRTPTEIYLFKDAKNPTTAVTYDCTGHFLRKEPFPQKVSDQFFQKLKERKPEEGQTQLDALLLQIEQALPVSSTTRKTQAAHLRLASGQLREKKTQAAIHSILQAISIDPTVQKIISLLTPLSEDQKVQNFVASVNQTLSRKEILWEQKMDQIEKALTNEYPLQESMAKENSLEEMNRRLSSYQRVDNVQKSTHTYIWDIITKELKFTNYLLAESAAWASSLCLTLDTLLMSTPPHTPLVEEIVYIQNKLRTAIKCCAQLHRIYFPRKAIRTQELFSTLGESKSDIDLNEYLPLILQMKTFTLEKSDTIERVTTLKRAIEALFNHPMPFIKFFRVLEKIKAIEWNCEKIRSEAILALRGHSEGSLGDSNTLLETLLFSLTFFQDFKNHEFTLTALPLASTFSYNLLKRINENDPTCWRIYKHIHSISFTDEEYDSFKGFFSDVSETKTSVYLRAASIALWVNEINVASQFYKKALPAGSTNHFGVFAHDLLALTLLANVGNKGLFSKQLQLCIEKQITTALFKEALNPENREPRHRECLKQRVRLGKLHLSQSPHHVVELGHQYRLHSLLQKQSDKIATWGLRYLESLVKNDMWSKAKPVAAEMEQLWSAIQNDSFKEQKTYRLISCLIALQEQEVVRQTADLSKLYFQALISAPNEESSDRALQKLVNLDPSFSHLHWQERNIALQLQRSYLKIQAITALLPKSAP